MADDEALALLPAEDFRAKARRNACALTGTVGVSSATSRCRQANGQVSLTPLRKTGVQGGSIGQGCGKVAIVGGGWAGMAAAVAACEKGRLRHRCSRAFLTLGGRA